MLDLSHFGGRECRVEIILGVVENKCTVSFLSAVFGDKEARRFGYHTG